MAGKKWGILKSTNAEFIVPDNFSKYSVLPLSPKIELVEGRRTSKSIFDRLLKSTGWPSREAIATTLQEILPDVQSVIAL